MTTQLPNMELGSFWGGSPEMAKIPNRLETCLRVLQRRDGLGAVRRLTVSRSRSFVFVRLGFIMGGHIEHALLDLRVAGDLG
jgi:hypothetical protein